MINNPDLNSTLRQVYDATRILRHPISGIVAGYHQLPYILIAPSEATGGTVEISGRINVSPRIIITPQQMRESFGDVFDPETFDGTIQGRLFSFSVNRNRNMKVESENLSVKNCEESPEAYTEQVLDRLQREEETRTGLISSPVARLYPVSLDRFINEILDREFRF